MWCKQVFCHQVLYHICPECCTAYSLEVSWSRYCHRSSKCVQTIIIFQNVNLMGKSIFSMGCVYVHKNLIYCTLIQKAVENSWDFVWGFGEKVASVYFAIPQCFQLQVLTLFFFFSFSGSSILLQSGPILFYHSIYFNFAPTCYALDYSVPSCCSG